jgi:hypothetical protein
MHYSSMGALINYQKRKGQEMDSVIPELLRSLGDTHIPETENQRYEEGSGSNKVREYTTVADRSFAFISRCWVRHMDAATGRTGLHIPRVVWMGTWPYWVPKLAPVSPPMFTT